MLVATLVEKLAKSLLEAERIRTPMSPLTDFHPDLTEEDSYHIQDALVAARGEARVGYKLGFTSEAMRQQMGIPEPNYGQLTQSMQVNADDQTIALTELIHPRVEPEVALLVEKDLSGPGLKPTDVYPAVRWAFGAIEVVDSRFHDYRFQAQDNIADNSSAARFVLGDPVFLTAVHKPRLAGAILWRNGQLVDSGVGANAMGDPFLALAWLANRLGTQGETLEEGSIVLTGGLTRAHPVSEGGTFTAEFGGLGSSKVHFGEEE